jgi:hypothetical protein
MRFRTVLVLGAGALGVAASRARAERYRQEAGARVGSAASPGAKARAVIDLTLERARDVVDARIGRQGAGEPPTVLADYYRSSTAATDSSRIPA